MANQLVSLPPHIVRALLDADVWGRWFPEAEDFPKISFQAVDLPSYETAVAVLAWDPHLAWDNWQYRTQSVFTLLLTPQLDPDCHHLPRPLPDELVEPLFRAVVTAVSPALTGHDAVELFGLLDAAAQQPNALPLPPRTRLPRNRFERRLRNTALTLERRFAPALEELRGEISQYDHALLHNALGPIIGDLATEGRLAETFSLRPGDTDDCLTLCNDDTRSISNLLYEFKLSRSLRYTSRRMLQEIAPDSPIRRQALSAFHIAQLYGRGVADLDPNCGSPLWRRANPKSSEFPYKVPAGGIERAMLRFADVFDHGLLADIDPVIKATLCWWQFLRIQPFGQFDRLIAEVLVNITLRQAGLPPLPLPMVMHRRYWDHAHALQIGLEQDQCDILAATMIAASKEALRLGRDMMVALDVERACLTTALQDVDGSLVESTTVVPELLSNVLVTRVAGSDLSEAARRESAFLHLHATGQIDKIVAGDKVWWSSEIVRNLADSR